MFYIFQIKTDSTFYKSKDNRRALILKDICTSFLMFCQTVWTCISFKRARWSGSVYAEFISFNRIAVLKNIGKTQI